MDTKMLLLDIDKLFERRIMSKALCQDPVRWWPLFSPLHACIRKGFLDWTTRTTFTLPDSWKFSEREYEVSIISRFTTEGRGHSKRIFNYIKATVSDCILWWKTIFFNNMFLLFLYFHAFQLNFLDSWLTTHATFKHISNSVTASEAQTLRSIYAFFQDLLITLCLDVWTNNRIKKWLSCREQWTPAMAEVIYA